MAAKTPKVQGERLYLAGDTKPACQLYKYLSKSLQVK